LNAASAASREVVVLRVLSAGILCPRARLHFLKRKLGSHTKACDRRRLLFVKSSTVSASPLEMYKGVQGYVWLKLITPTIIVPTGHGFWKPRRGVLGFIAGWLVGPYLVAGPLAEDGSGIPAVVAPRLVRFRFRFPFQRPELAECKNMRPIARRCAA
jgi:hypothetical protein